MYTQFFFRKLYTTNFDYNPTILYAHIIIREQKYNHVVISVVLQTYEYINRNEMNNETFISLKCEETTGKSSLPPNLHLDITNNSLSKRIHV